MASEKEDAAIIVPFLKWAGGKRWLASSSTEIIPEKFNNYIEPFVGSGAMFFNLQPASALLSDINPDLIDTYKAIKSNWRKVIGALKRHHTNHSESYYYKIRASHPRSLCGLAAKFIYLNRTCWNGLYRVNQQGKFNVPIGSKSEVILDSDDFAAVAALLKTATLRCQDFEVAINSAKAGDFLFVDPPYTVKHNLNGFIKYNQKLFSWEDQIRLKRVVTRAADRGVSVLVSNADHKSIRDLYSDFSQQSIERFSRLAANSKHRVSITELFIKNF